MLSVLLGLIAILHPVTVPHIPAPKPPADLFAVSGDFSIESATVTLSCRWAGAKTDAQGYVWASGPSGLSIGYTDAYCLNGAITYRIK